MEFLNLIGLDWSALEDAIRLVVAMVVGALVGWERERGNRPAGLRTHMLVCMGSCLVMTASIWFAHETGMGDAMRMGAQVISGIGFLGAGTIIKDDHGVKGLTTAASLWVVACIGLALGAGFYWGAILCAGLTYAALVFFKHIEERAAHAIAKFHLVARDDSIIAGHVVDALLEENVVITEFVTRKVKGKLLMTVHVGYEKGAERPPKLIEKLTAIEGIESVKDR